jgi:hypothetical protein
MQTNEQLACEADSLRMFEDFFASSKVLRQELAYLRNAATQADHPDHRRNWVTHAVVLPPAGSEAQLRQRRNECLMKNEGSVVI